MKVSLVRGLIEDVRYHLNEELENESLQLTEVGEDIDDNDIDAVVRNHIVEAVDYIHKIAPVELLDGLSAVRDTDYTVSVVDNVIPDIHMLRPVLRIFSFRTTDTPFNVREVYPEGSAQGHMQLKPWTRGTWDRPALIAQADSENWEPHLRYYTLKEVPSDTDFIAEFLFVPKQFGASLTEEGEEYFLISSQLYESVVNYLTGLVLNTYGEHDRAQVYFGRAETK